MLLLKDWRRDVCARPASRCRPAEASLDLNEALDKSTVADLSSSAIEQMTCEELVRVITAAELPQQLGRGRSLELPYGDREALLRLAHLARRCCRNQGY